MEQTPEADMTTLKEGTDGRSFSHLLEYHGRFAETQESKLKNSCFSCFHAASFVQDKDPPIGLEMP